MLSLGSRSWHVVARAVGTAVILATLIVGCSTIRSMMPSAMDALIARRPPFPAGAPPPEPGRPFDIGEYTGAAEQFTRTATEVRLLLAVLDGAAPALASTLGDTVAQGRSP